jgi:hypothetical protein
LNYREELHGVPRKGQALLQGIVRCGYCGAFLHLRYSGPQGDFPVYVCNNDQRQFGGKRCQEVQAMALDAQVEQRFLEALRPDQVALALAALAQSDLQHIPYSERRKGCIVALFMRSVRDTVKPCWCAASIKINRHFSGWYTERRASGGIKWYWPFIANPKQNYHYSRTGNKLCLTEVIHFWCDSLCPTNTYGKRIIASTLPKSFMPAYT